MAVLAQTESSAVGHTAGNIFARSAYSRVYHGAGRCFAAMKGCSGAEFQRTVSLRCPEKQCFYGKPISPLVYWDSGAPLLMQCFSFRLLLEDGLFI